MKLIHQNHINSGEQHPIQHNTYQTITQNIFIQMDPSHQYQQGGFDGMNMSNHMKQQPQYGGMHMPS